MNRTISILALMIITLSMVACNAFQREQTVPQILPTAEVPADLDVSGGDAYPAPTADGSAEVPTGVPPVVEDESVPQSDLIGTAWEWVTLLDPMGQTIIEDPTSYTIAFDEDESAAIRADCNSVAAAYFADRGTLSISLGASTLVACGPDSQDSLFLNSLSRVESYGIEDGELYVELVGDTGTLVFRQAGSVIVSIEQPEMPAGVAALIGTTWQWVQTQTPVELITAADPTRYTIEFLEDGTAGIRADCNSVGASYSVSDSSLAIVLGPTTLVGCPEDTQDGVFLAGLSSAAGFFFEESNLYIDLMADSGTMKFMPAMPAAEGEAGMGEAMPLTGVAWQWTASAGVDTVAQVADPTRYQITFNDDSSLNIKADCNTVLGSYLVDESGSITITLGPTTLVACPADSQDAEFLNGLANARFYFIEENQLSIEVSEDGTTLQLMAADATGEPPAVGLLPVVPVPTGLVGSVWQWTELVRASGTTAVPNPANFTIQFNADGTANLRADCNTGGAAYTAAADGALTITPGVLTSAYCGDQSLDQVFLGGLTNAAAWRLEGSNLIIDMLYESGRLVFVAGQ